METIERGGWQLAFRESGAPHGPAILFLHSLGLDSQSWEPQAAALGDRFRIVCADVRGHGSSQAPKPPYSIEDLGGDSLAVADHLGIERFHVVGLSIGGLTALWLAVHHPHRLLTATFCNTAAKIGNEAFWQARLEALRDGGMAAIAGDVLPRFFTPGFESRQPRLYAHARDVFLRTDPSGYGGCCAALRDADLRQQIGSIHVPSLNIGGAQDLATPPELTRQLHERIAGSESVILENAGHISNLERPQVFTRALRAHLGRALQAHLGS